MIISYGFFLTDGTYINHQVLHFQNRIGAFGGTHEMNRFCCDNAGYVFTQCIADQDFRGRQCIQAPSAKFDKTDGSVFMDGVNHKSYFIAVGVKHHKRFFTCIGMTADIEIAQMVFFQGSDRLCKRPGSGNSLILKSGRGFGV